MVAATRERQRNTGRGRSFHCRVEGAHSDQGADTIVSIDPHQSGSHALQRDGRTWIDSFDLQPLPIRFDAADAVRAQAEHFSKHQDTGCVRGILTSESQSDKRTCCQFREFGF
jgi:hypothetical protein